FSAEKRVAESADELNIVRDRLGKRDDAAGVDAELLAGREIELQHVAAGMQEEQTLSADLLQDESFAAEKSGAETLGEGDRQIDVADRAEKRVPLREDSRVVQLNRKNLSRDWIGKREFPACLIAAEHAHEHRFAGQKLSH